MSAAQPVATADIPPPPVLSQDQLRQMPSAQGSPNPAAPPMSYMRALPTAGDTLPTAGTRMPVGAAAPAGMTPVASGDNTSGQDPIGQLYQDIVGRERSGATAISPKGAIGIGQIMPSTAAQYGVSREALFDPKVNEQVSKHIISDLWNKYHDADAVRVAYNAGPGWANRWLASGRDSSILPHETQNYLTMSSTGGANIPYANEQQAAAQAIQADLYGASDRARKQADGFMSEVKDFKKDLAGSLQRIHEARGRSDEAIAKATEAANYQPKPPLIDGFANLGSLGAIIGMMGGLLTKSPMIASLNAGAAAIEAANRGDMAQYERAYDSWKTSSDMLFKIVDLQQKRAQEIMGDEKFMTEEKRVGLDLYLRAINQEQLADEIRIRGTQFGYEHFKTMGAAAEKYDENRIRLQENHEQHRATQETQRMRVQETIENDRMRNELGRDRLQQGGELGHERNDISRERLQQSGELGGEKNQIARDRLEQTGKLGEERNQIARVRLEQTGELGHERNDIARNRLEQSGTLGRERNEIARDRLKQSEQKDPGRSYYYDWRNKYIEEHDGEPPSEELDSKRFQEFQRFYPKASASGQKELSVPMSDDAIDMSARRSLKGDHSAVVGLGYGTVGANNRTKINNRMSELAKEMGISPEQVAAMQLEFSGRRAEIQALGRRQAVLDSAVVEAQTLMPQVIQTSENVSRTRFTDINTILLSGERRTGDPNVVRFGIALNSFINVYARAMNPTGVPTVSDKEHARALLATSWTKGQIQAAMDQLGIEMNAAYRASDTVWRDIISRTASNEPRGPEFLKQAGGGGATGTQTGQDSVKPPSGIPEGSHIIGTSKGRNVWQAPDGTKWSE